MTRDEWRSARLLFSPELSSGELDYAELARPEVFDAVRSRRFGGPVQRTRQRLAQRRGRLEMERDLFGPLMHARRAVLGDRAYGAPRIVVRVDEFPHCQVGDQPKRFGTEHYARFHHILRDAGVPYLAAILSRIPREPYNPQGKGSRSLDESELAYLETMRRDGVAFATHGFDHRTLHKRSRRHSELVGLKDDGLSALLDRATAQLGEHGLDPRVFVPPYNRFHRNQYQELAGRYDVVCGGPESVGMLGFHRAPLWRGDAVYFPSYSPLYGRAEQVVQAVERLAALEVPVWAQVTLHWGWELEDGFAGLERAVRRLAAFARPWGAFLDEVAQSRETVESVPSTRLLASPARRRPGYRSGRGSQVA